LERTIGLFRSSDTQVVQSRSWLPDEGVSHSYCLYPIACVLLLVSYCMYPIACVLLPDEGASRHRRVFSPFVKLFNRYVNHPSTLHPSTHRPCQQWEESFGMLLGLPTSQLTCRSWLGCR